MDQQQAQMMQSYPDPTAVSSESNGPFYAPNPSSQQQPQSQQQEQAQQPQPPQEQAQQPQQQHQQQQAQAEADQQHHLRQPMSDLAAQQRAIEGLLGATGGQPLDLKAMLGFNEDGSRVADQPQQQQPQVPPAHQMMGDMGQSQGPSQNMYQGTPADGTTPRKRSKVSRACDECRRKKIRCDATTESGGEACTSCRRVGTSCQFSRVPMKRGPSKGYIKELADRLNHLEQGLQHNQPSEPLNYPQAPSADMGIPRRESQDFSPPPQMDGALGRKRTHSSISQEFGTPGGYAQQNLVQRQSGQWNQYETPRHPAAQAFAQAPAEQYRVGVHSPNGLAPQAQFPSARENYYFAEPTDAELQDMNNQGEFNFNEAAYDEHYRLVHFTFPILPPKDVLYDKMRRSPVIVVNACFAAMEALTTALNGIHNPEVIRRASTLIAQSTQNDFSRLVSGRYVVLTSLLLMAVEGGYSGNSTSSQSAYLGQAVALSQDLRLHAFKQGESHEEYSDELFGRKLWWTSIIIDRFRAAGRAVPLMIPESSCVLYKEDAQILGQHMYELARISLALGNVATFIGTPIVASPSHALAPIKRLIGSVIHTQLEDIRLSLPADYTFTDNAPMTLAFWYTRLLLRRLQDNADPAESLTDARDILGLVPGTISPLVKDAVIVAIVTLMELLDDENLEISSEAEKELKTFMSSPPRHPPASWDSDLRELILPKIIKTASPTQNHSQPQNSQIQPQASNAALTASQGLQHLADLATAGDTDRSEPEQQRTEVANAAAVPAWDKEKLTYAGVLNILSGRAFIRSIQ